MENKIIQLNKKIYMEVAEKAFDADNFDAAASYYEKAIKSDDFNGEDYISYCHMLFREGYKESSYYMTMVACSLFDDENILANLLNLCYLRKETDSIFYYFCVLKKNRDEENGQGLAPFLMKHAEFAGILITLLKQNGSDELLDLGEEYEDDDEDELDIRLENEPSKYRRAFRIVTDETNAKEKLYNSIVNAAIEDNSNKLRAIRKNISEYTDKYKFTTEETETLGELLRNEEYSVEVRDYIADIALLLNDKTLSAIKFKLISSKIRHRVSDKKKYAEMLLKLNDDGSFIKLLFYAHCFDEIIYFVEKEYNWIELEETEMLYYGVSLSKTNNRDKAKEVFRRLRHIDIYSLSYEIDYYLICNYPRKNIKSLPLLLKNNNEILHSETEVLSKLSENRDVREIMFADDKSAYYFRLLQNNFCINYKRVNQKEDNDIAFLNELKLLLMKSDDYIDKIGITRYILCNYPNTEINAVQNNLLFNFRNGSIPFLSELYCECATDFAYVFLLGYKDLCSDLYSLISDMEERLTECGIDYNKLHNNDKRVIKAILGLKYTSSYDFLKTVSDYYHVSQKNVKSMMMQIYG